MSDRPGEVERNKRDQNGVKIHLEREQLRRVSTARAILVDEAAIIADFPSLAGEAPEDISNWLEDEAGLIAVAQLNSSKVNTKISTAGPTRSGFRPARYGRASIVPLSGDLNIDGHSNAKQQDGATRRPATCLDIKGIGVKPGRLPKPGYHSTGLLRLDSALEEYLWAKMIDRILAVTGAPARALPIYGVLDLGFDIRLDDIGVNAPAGLIVRRAHARPPLSDLPFSRSPMHRASLAIELTLRFYGVTSSGDETVVLEECEDDPKRVLVRGLPNQAIINRAEVGIASERLLPLELDYCNIQTALPGREGLTQLVDFGQFRWREKFVRPLLSTVADQPAAFGGILWEDRPEFPQPKANRLIPAVDWGSRSVRPGEEVSPHVSGADGIVRIPTLICDRLVVAARSGKIDAHEVRQKIDSIVRRSLCGDDRL